jgi:chromate reductase
MPTMAQPEAYLHHAAAFFGPDGRLTDDKMREFLTGFAVAFADWIERTRQGA